MRPAGQQQAHHICRIKVSCHDSWVSTCCFWTVEGRWQDRERKVLQPVLASPWAALSVLLCKCVPGGGVGQAAELTTPQQTQWQLQLAVWAARAAYRVGWRLPCCCLVTRVLLLVVLLSFVHCC